MAIKKSFKCDKCGFRLDDELCTNKECTIYGNNGKLVATSIDVQVRNIKTTEQIKRPLLWYDSETHTMKEMVGGQLQFTYDYDHSKMLINAGAYRKEFEEWLSNNSKLGIESFLEGGKTFIRFPKEAMQKVNKSLTNTHFSATLLKSQLIVEAKPLEFTCYRSVDNYNSIIKWAEMWSNSFLLEIIIADSRSVVVRYPSNFMDDVLYTLEEAGLSSEQVYA